MKRKAFGMIYAIIITVLVATLGILGLKMSATTLDTTTNEHIAIQLDLYLNSTAELAILYIQRNGFVYEETNDNTATTQKRTNPMEPIVKNINYGANSEYKFTYKITPLMNNDIGDGEEEDKKNTMVLDITGFVVSPITNQTFRVTKRQIIKP